MKGFINLIKPSGMSSAYAIVAVKKKFHIPCGHMGTLDPMASGVLPVGIGQTSRLFPYLLDKEKRYIATFKFGVLTDTLDTTGTVMDTTSVIPSEEDIKRVLSDFVGEIDQIPPKYSAKYVDGKRSYELARKGVDFTLESKKVTVDGIELLERVSENEFKFRIDCRGGTYIRSLARDIAEKTGSLGIMSALVRSKCGIFDLENGVSVDDFKNAEDAEKFLIKSEDAVSYNSIVLDEREATRLLNGLYDEYDYKDGLYKVFNRSEFWGIGEVKDGKIKMRCYVR